ncbi:MAG: hypothetical protein MZW92_48135 [Comamonadaceae bacterium]|nr:hypothetical protein [Comamonadaceae bacterium]
MAWGGGETPALAGVVDAGRIDLAASCVGLVQPEGAADAGRAARAPATPIVLLASSGIHANGAVAWRASWPSGCRGGYLTRGRRPASMLRRGAAGADAAVFAGDRGAVPRPASCRTTRPTSPATAGASCCATRRA